MTIFLSYSTKDYFFAELAEIKLAEKKINLWRDQGSLVAGSDWRQGIEKGISDSLAVLIALSTHSVESSFVTYEWAYAIGNGKTVIPVKISPCQMHPRLEAIQYLDFTNPGSLPWDSLIERIKEIEIDSEKNLLPANSISDKSISTPDDFHVKAILDYLNQRGYQMASFERIRKRVDSELSDAKLNQLIDDNKTIFRHTIIKDDKENKSSKKGIAKIIP